MDNRRIPFVIHSSSMRWKLILPKRYLSLTPQQIEEAIVNE